MIYQQFCDKMDIQEDKLHFANPKYFGAVCASVGRKKNGTRATALVSMTDKEKARLREKAQEHGLSLSAFFRLAADEYIKNHDW